MPVDDKVESEGEQKEAQEAVPEPKSRFPLILICAVAFVITVGMFSVMMGVFSSPPGTTTEKSAEAQADTTDPDQEAAEEVSEIKKLEKELLDLLNVEGIENLEDLVAMDEADAEAARQDSIDAVNWLEKEKRKLAAERAELNTRKRQLDNQEFRLKQLIEQVDQMESTRINALAKLYDGMKPAQVAPLIGKLTDRQAVQVLLKMKPANAAKILGALSPDQAAQISANMITLTEE